MLMGHTCLGLDCIGEEAPEIKQGTLTASQKVKASAMQQTLNNYLYRLRAYLQSGVTDVEDAERILSNGIDGFWSDVHEWGDWDHALYRYRGLVKIAEDALAVAQQQRPYSLPVASTAPSSQTAVANAVASQALEASIQVARQSEATQAATTPYYGAEQAAIAAARASRVSSQAPGQAAEHVAAGFQEQRQKLHSALKTGLVVVGVVAGIGAIMYIASRGK